MKHREDGMTIIQREANILAAYVLNRPTQQKRWVVDLPNTQIT